MCCPARFLNLKPRLGERLNQLFKPTSLPTRLKIGCSPRIVKDPLIEALSKEDASTRADRAERIRWLSPNVPIIRGFIAPVEATALMEEAKLCYVNGQFVATLVLAASFIEHKLADALRAKSLAKRGLTFEAAIKHCRQSQLFPDELLETTDRIRLIRNPFVHRKPDGHEHSLGTRFLNQKIHPKTIIENDAAMAIKAMYAYFTLTLVSS